MTEIKRIDKSEEPCCCPPAKAPAPDHDSGCLLCGKPLLYWPEARQQRCVICGRLFEANCACEDGHFVCDDCHRSGSDAFFLPLLLQSAEKDPLKLFEQLVALPRVHMHGPEHHSIVPCVLLTAYRNCGGELDLEKSVKEALRRSKQVPGGTCGYWGVCGAAAGAGIYMSILLGSNPVHKEAWPIPQQLVADCLQKLADTGGPRCCKRTGRLCISLAAQRTAEWLGVEMPLSEIRCSYLRRNRECLGPDCPYFPLR